MDVLDAQQQNILRHPERKLLDLKIDSGGVYARRIIERKLARHTIDWTTP
jgi:vanillate O-demethylase monooxygenase subunit